MKKHHQIRSIMLVLASNEDGGLEKHVIDIANQLAIQGLNVYFVAAKRYKSAIHQAVQFIAFDFNRSRYNLIALYQLYQLIKHYQPQIIHTHGAKAVHLVHYFIPFFRQIKFIASLHSVKKNTVAFNRYHHIICTSHAIVSCLSTQAQQKTTVILNGIKPPHLKKQISSHTRPRPILLAIGQLRKVKGFDILIKSVETLPVQLWIAGDGEEKEHLTALIQQTQQEGKVKLLGYRSDIDQLLAHADIHVISSLNEGGPYTFAESLLVNTPVISTKVGVPQSILPQEFLAETNSVEALYHLIKYSLNQPNLSQQFKPLFEWAETHLTDEAMVNQLMQVYSHA